MTIKPILAFDCSTSGASIALCVNGETHRRELVQGQQATALVSTIDALLASYNVAYTDLGCAITTVGPGSFTGLRIGLAALHGLVLATRVPIKTLTSLEALAWEVAQMPDAPTRFFTSLRAGKGEIYVQEFAIDTGIPSSISDITLAPEDTRDWSAPCYGNMQPEDSAFYLPAPNAAVICAIADQLSIVTLAEALPLYIRAPDAKIPASAAWLPQS